MNEIHHRVTHHYQPTNNSCSQAALATLLSHYDYEISPEEIMQAVPVMKNDQGEPWGTINQQLATWCLSQDFDVEIHTPDFQILDLSWKELAKDQLLEKLESVKNVRDIPALGKQWSRIYVQSYQDFLNAGGDLHIHQHMTTRLIDDLLTHGPLLSCVCSNVLYGGGRDRDVALRKSELDDVNGKLTNHSIVIHGKNLSGDYLIADPWKEPGFFAVKPETMLCAMTAAQMECDNLVFQLAKKNL